VNAFLYQHRMGESNYLLYLFPYLSMISEGLSASFISIFIWAIIGIIAYLYVISARYYRADLACSSSCYISHFTLFHFTFFIAQHCFFPSPISHGGERLTIW
jgi:hypothetical protein